MASACQRMQAAVSGMSSPTVSVIGLPASIVSMSPSSRALRLDQVGPRLQDTRFRAAGIHPRPDAAVERPTGRPPRPRPRPRRRPSATSVIGWPVAGFSVANRRPSRARPEVTVDEEVGPERGGRQARTQLVRRSGISVSVMRCGSLRSCPQRFVTGDHGTAPMVLATQSQPNRNVVASPEARLWKPTPASVPGHRPGTPAARAAGRSVNVIARAQESTADGHHHPPARPDHPRHRRRPHASVDRPPRPRQPADRRAGRGRDPRRRGADRGRGPARRPDRQAHRPLAPGQVHRRRAIEHAARSGGARSTGRSARRTTTACAPGSSPTAPRSDLYSQDCFIGADPAHQRRLRVYTETAWASIFARNLFRRPERRRARRLRARTSRSSASPRSRPTRRPRAPGPGPRSCVHLERMEVIIVGTEYAGEIKKSAFTVMNYLMPDEGVLPMHSSVNVGADGDSAVFFGLSGTGKTTLSADPRAQPHRRRRARLGRRRPVQLRGRLLRQDDPPLADVRAGHLPDDPAVRDGPRERRPRPGDPRARPRLGAVHREHPRRLPARLHRQRRPDRDDRSSRGPSSS